MSKYKEILKKYWGYDGFRSLQEEIVESIGNGKDTLALMPTGGGKSITFQVPAMSKEGICLVVTPLIALMKDQVENLKKREIKAYAIHSGLSGSEIATILDNCVFGDIKFLYLSPERLASEMFRVRVQQMNVSMIAVDEAHCISQWGYDFRPSYLKISELRELLPEAPVLALTATATPAVAKDIMKRLNFSVDNVLQKSFARDNLVYVVRRTEDKYKEMLKIVNSIKGAGVIYVRNRKKTRDIAEILQKNRIKADYYHAGLRFEDRMRKQEAWQNDKIRIMVATNAFGMGIDKADVRFVIHIDLPDSPEAYFQEAGRGGRDERRAWAVLLFSPSDVKLVEKRIDVNFPSFDTLRDVYKSLFTYLQVPIGGGKGGSYDFILGEFLSQYKYNALTATSALKILAREGYFDITEEIAAPSRIHFIIGRDDLYKFQIRNSKFDGFIKLLLRSYSGLFSQYVNIDEYTLSKRSGLSEQDVYKYLVKLGSLKVVNYIPRKGNPVITLLEERLEDKNIYLSIENYKFRKERYVDRINAMLEYVQSETKCRSQFLLSYFGETKAERCGQCDVCLQEKEKMKLTETEYQKLFPKVLDLLRDEPLGMVAIGNKLNMEEEIVVLVLDKMLEDGKLKRGEDLRFIPSS